MVVVVCVHVCLKKMRVYVCLWLRVLWGDMPTPQSWCMLGAGGVCVCVFKIKMVMATCRRHNHGECTVLVVCVYMCVSIKK